MSPEDSTPPDGGEQDPEPDIPLPGNARIYWLTTAPNPRSPATGWDAGQRGWKVHAVVVEAGEERWADIGLTRSLCGRSPSHGWGLDLFITDPCSACERIASRWGAFQDAPTWRRTDLAPLTVVIVPVEAVGP